MSSNVHRLPVSDPGMRALTLVHAYQPGWLDRILTDERRRLAADDKVTGIVDELAAVGRAVWLRRDSDTPADPRAEQAIRWAVRLEQQLAEIDRIAEQWTRLREPTKAAMGRLIHDTTRGQRGDDPEVAS